MEKTKTHILCLVILFHKYCCLWAIVENLIVRGRPQVTIWRMRIACWMPKATNTYSQYVTLIASPHQQRLHERPSLLRYPYIYCPVRTLDRITCGPRRVSAAVHLLRLRVRILSVCGCLCFVVVACCKIELSVLADHPSSGFPHSVGVSKCGHGTLIISRSRSTMVCCVMEKAA